MEKANRPPQPANALRIFESYAQKYAELVLRFRFLVILFSLVIAVGLGTGMQRIQFAADARVFFGENNPERIALDDLEDTYSKSTVVLFVVTPKDGTVFTQGNLTAIAEMTERAWQLPFTLRVDSIANFNSTRAEGDDIIVEPLYSADQINGPDDVGRIKQATLNEKEIVNRLISPAGDVAAVVTTLVLPEGDRNAAHPTAQAAREMAADWRQVWPGFEVRLTGGVIADKTFAEAGERDRDGLVPIMGIILLVTLLTLLRSLAGTIGIVVIVVISVISTLGLIGWAGFLMNAATGSSPVAIMVIVVASSVHLVLTWRQHQRSGKTGREAVTTALMLNAAPITVTNLTTAIGFLCMNFSESPPLRDMGNIVAMGTIFGWLFTLSALPALLSLFTRTRSSSPGPVERAMPLVADFIIRRKLPLLLIFAILLPGLAVGLTRIEFDDDYVRYFGQSFEFRRDTEYAERRLTGLNIIRFSLKAGESGAVFEPEFLEKTDRFATWLKEQPGVVFVDSITDLFKRLNRTVNADDPAFYKIAETRPENAQNLLLYELGLPVGHDLNSIIDIDRSSTRVSAVVRDVSSGDIRRLALAAEEWLDTNTPEIAAPATGLSMVFAYISQRNITGMIIGTLTALLLISAIMLPAFQSIRFGLVSLIPNLVPAFIAFGIWGLAVGQVNLASSVVCSMTLGIVVDDTVHIMMKYLRARRVDALSAEQAVRQVMPTVGLALLITSISLAAGFAVIGSSGFQLSQHLGSLTTIVVVAALIADFFLLLPLVMVFDKWLT